ncbi:cation:proton antiporter [Pinirhizobacter soli]|uniref:cation:proton antiporter n=1 Tax=Pinirhizobacter soli TaxID=2786953 RepID=UPI00202A7ABB|nr:cation:proton antiporter [Pinirhizobacter soli]
MDFLGWTAAVGVLLLAMSLASGLIQRGPITSFGLFLAAGIIAGPWGLDIVRVDISGHVTWLGHVTEMALVASLFITGLKLRLPFSDIGWRLAWRLAFPAMVLTVAGLAWLVHAWLGFPWPLALALAAILAPTDPVLASLISVDDASDDDNLRVSLSGEAGLNDGSAMPVLLLAMALLAPNSASPWARWFAVDVLWGLFAGVAIGFAIGWCVGLIGARLKSLQKDIAPSDFLALALMALSYAAAQSVSASGFLAAFAAGVGLRRAELYVVERHPHSSTQNDDDEHPPAEVLVNPNRRHVQDAGDPAESVGWVVSDALSFGDTVERLIAAGLVFLLGAALAPRIDLVGLGLALALFVVIRPAAVWIATMGSGAPRPRRLLFGWLGIRGIGSVNYLAYALTHGLQEPAAGRIADLTVTVVVASIVLHGVTVTPLLNWRQARLDSREARKP